MATRSVCPVFLKLELCLICMMKEDRQLLYWLPDSVTKRSYVSLLIKDAGSTKLHLGTILIVAVFMAIQIHVVFSFLNISQYR